MTLHAPMEPSSSIDGSGHQQAKKNAVLRYIPIMVTLAAGICLAFVMLVVARGWEWNRIAEDFDVDHAQRAKGIGRHVGNLVAATNGVEGFYAGSGLVDALEFGTYIKYDTSSYLEARALEAMTYVPRVPESDRERFLREDLTALKVEGLRINAQTGVDNYFPVLYRQPPNTPEFSLGQDLYNDPAYEGAISLAWRTGEPAITAAMKDTRGVISVRIIAPIYKNGKPTRTEGDRLANLQGVVVYAIDIPELIHDAMSQLGFGVDDGGVHLFVTDESGDVDNPEMYAAYSQSTAGKDVRFDGLERETAFTIGGRTWSVKTVATPEFVSAHRTAQPWVVFGVLIAGSLIMSAMLFRVVKRGDEVAAMATELSQSHAMLEERVKERTLELEQTLEGLEGANEAIRQQSEAIMELSTPVIRVWSGVVLMPLIGVIDTNRSQQIMDRLLSEISETDAKVALLDVTGVPLMDTSVAGHLIRVVEAARLLGAEVIVTGFSPDAAQTLTQLSVDFGALRTRGSLRSGVAEALRLIKHELAS